VAHIGQALGMAPPAASGDWRDVDAAEVERRAARLRRVEAAARAYIANDGNGDRGYDARAMIDARAALRAALDGSDSDGR
jgi:hypothetical protein